MLGDKFKEIINENRHKYQQVRLWTQDETRIGLMPIHRKRITAKGVRPLIRRGNKAQIWLFVWNDRTVDGQRFYDGNAALRYGNDAGIYGRIRARRSGNFAFDIGGQRLTAHDRQSENRRKYSIYIFAGEFTGVESD